MQERGLVKITNTLAQGTVVELTLAGAFWNQTLCQIIIRLLQQETAQREEHQSNLVA